MYLKRVEIVGFKSFAKKTTFTFESAITAIVGPNGSGKSNVAEAFRWVLGEQSMKSLRGKRGEDLIFNGSANTTRLNRASVTIVFDNSKKKFDIDFEEVLITREVFRDGTNNYFINKTLVRLKDIIELLSAVSLGTSNHHIISQGEADRILNASPRDRRTMIEDALGLKVYHWKTKEAQRKLEKTENNLKEVESLRREISGHMRFLKKESEKIEKSEAMREEIKTLYLTYLKKEELYLAQSKKQIAENKKNPLKEHTEIEAKIAHLEKSQGIEPNKDDEEIRHLETELTKVRGEKDEISRSLGRIEGMVEIAYAKRNSSTLDSKEVHASFSSIKNLIMNVSEKINSAKGASDLERIREILKDMQVTLDAFLSEFKTQDGTGKNVDSEIENFHKEKKELDDKVTEIIKKENDITHRIESIREQIILTTKNEREQERELYALRERRSTLSSVLEQFKFKEGVLDREQADFDQELREAHALVGSSVSDYKNKAQSLLGDVFDRKVQESAKHAIQKIKIRLEDIGPFNADVLKEYKEVVDRDAFLGREIEDLEKTAKALNELIKELIEKLDVEFRQGTEKINKQFSVFFTTMFQGGAAKLSIFSVPTSRRNKDLEISDEDIDMEEAEEESGIDIQVNLPRKKIRGLEMLSGGERALTSIALLFAMSQVKPPPFLILDETDAALDEANSKRYGDMIEGLSKYSQLIVITHNRETMSRAGVIYGVTMDSDAISKILSIKFEEAEAIAK